MLKVKVWFVVISLFGIFASACNEKETMELERTLNNYLIAANEHDIATLAEMTAEDAVWYLGQDTLVGRDEVLRPLKFDAGANTVLNVSNVLVRGDTIDFDLLERNDVLTAIGISELHHFPRFIFREGLIYRILPRRPPLEIEAFSDSVMAFVLWVRDNRPNEYNQLWPNGRFIYGRDGAELMLSLINERKSMSK